MVNEPYLRHCIITRCGFSLDRLCEAMYETINLVPGAFDGAPSACWNVIETPILDLELRKMFLQFKAGFLPNWAIHVMPLDEDEPRAWMANTTYTGIEFRTDTAPDTIEHLQANFEAAVALFEKTYAVLGQQLSIPARN
jgi:hypothetical protein